MFKTCSMCQTMLSIELFNKSSKDGFQSSCKLCYKTYQAKRYIEKKEQINAQNKSYYERNREQTIKKTTEYHKNRKLVDPLYKAGVNLRRRLNRAVKARYWQKQSHLTEYIGCDQAFFKAYIESKFGYGMSWNNYGEWHLDHIIPLSTAKGIVELEKLCHYSNLQPLWAADNLRKSNKVG